MSRDEPISMLDWPLSGMQLVEASAGTGKTWTLCALVLRLVLEGRRRIDEILVVTFTQAATAELSQRVRERLTQARSAAQARLQGQADMADPLLTHLLDRVGARGHEAQAAVDALDHALRSFDEAAIYTIHAYCQRALAEAPFAAGLPMDAPQVGDDQELVDEVAQDFWRRHVVSGELPPALVAHLRACGDLPQRWAGWLKSCSAKPLAKRLWPDEVPAWGCLSRSLKDAPLVAALDAMRSSWQDEGAAIERAWLSAQSQLSGTVYRKGRAERTWAQWAGLLGGAQRSDWGDAQWVKDLSYLGWRRMSAAVKKGQQLSAHAVFVQVDCVLDAADAYVQSLQMARLRLLRHLVDWGADELVRRKRERRLLAYDDMLANLHRALREDANGQLAARLRARHPVALVDEFQDTDPQQYDIFERIYVADAPDEHDREPGESSPGLLFLVGDPKQAIYGFRNADLPTYLRARQRARRVHRLDANQRSGAALLHAQNALFGHRPDAFLQEGLSHPPVRLGAKARGSLSLCAEPVAALELWPLPDVQPTPAEAAKPGSRRPTRVRAVAEAVSACADDIARLLSSGAGVDGRALIGGDVAVLVRTHHEGRAVRLALAQRGVPCVERSRESVWRSAEAPLLSTVLQAVAEPRATGLVRTALATPLLGWTADRIVGLDVDPQAQADVMAEFARLHGLWQGRGVGVVLRELQGGPLSNPQWLCAKDGDRRWTNWRHLGELLQAREAQTQAAPKGLLRWLQTQRDASRSGADAQLRLESDAELVQVVTVHASKGLEYAVVYAPLLWLGAGRRGGSALPWVERAEQRVTVLDFHPDAQAVHADALAAQAHAEAMRLLYVALTRAVHRCVLVVGSYRASARANDWPGCIRAPLNAWLLAPERGASEEHALEADAAWRNWAEATRADWVASGGCEKRPAVRWVDWPRPLASGAAMGVSWADDCELAALPAPTIPQGWRLSSYSALLQAAREDEETDAVDHDAQVPLPESSSESSQGASPLVDFPRGARAGECVHAVFEHAVFDDPDQWPSAVDTALRAHRGVWEEADDPRAGRSARELLAEMLDDVMRTPLPGAGCLVELPAAHARTEWEFHLSAPKLNPGRLGRVLRQRGVVVPDMQEQDWGGYLRGFIDLVFFAQGRWHIVDWKSNHLGAMAADYAQPALKRAMDEAHYPLQAVLYALALHRYLRARLPGYEPARHLGGVYYLFVRGMGPQRVDQDGHPLGVYVIAPSIETLIALDQALGGVLAREDSDVG